MALNDKNINKNYLKLAKNTTIFAIGSFGSKVLSFLIVPLYTFVLSTAEYGQIDLFITAINLLLPFSTLLIQEAILRFLMGGELEEKNVLNNSIFVFVVSTIFSIALFPLFKFIFKLGDNTLVFISILTTNSFVNIFSQYLRAKGKNIEFAINGIINTVVFLSCNVIFLLILDIGMKGYLYSLLLSNIICSIFILWKSHMVPDLSIHTIDFNSLKKMLRFSIPLIPNTIMWWIISAGDKYTINYFLGDDMNGLYSFAMKVPAAMIMVFSIFYQAWQMSAIEVKDQDDSNSFYNNVFKTTNCLLALMISAAIMAVKPVFAYAVSKSFYPSWQYVPLLSVATYFSCIASFFDVVYTVTLKSHKAFYTTMIGAVLNIILNIPFVKAYGLFGVIISTTISYAAISLVRAKDASKELNMKFDTKRTLLMILIITAQAILTLLFQGKEIYIFGIIGLTSIIYLYFKEIQFLVNMILRRLT